MKNFPNELFDPESPLAVGPIVWDIQLGHDQRKWYFVVGGKEREATNA